MAAEIIEFDRVSAGYTPSISILNELTIDARAGEITLLIGPNGAGKSTLLNVIAGTLRPAAGRLFLEDTEITGWPEARRAGRIGRVFQHPFTGSATELSVAENLVLAARRGGPRGLRVAVTGARRAELRDRVARLGMGLEDRLDTPMGALSGGERQALTVLMATLVRPALLLLDEHTAALDPRSAERVTRLTQEVIVAGRLTTLLVTHSLSQAVRLADRVLVMHRGRLAHDLPQVHQRRVAEDELLALFDRLRWADALNQSTAAMLHRAYL